ncbi:MAG: alkaline serine protease, partial [Bdellovibrio sp.]
PGAGDTGGAIQALNYAAARGAKIINASWGGPTCSNILQATIENLSEQGLLIVVAAGNDGNDLDTMPEYPAVDQVPGQITVAAIRSSGFMDVYSNTSFNFVHIAAPGTGILSTVIDHGTALMSGTSMATPFVSGAAALLWGLRPQATAADIKSALLKSVDTGPYRVSSQGRLNVRKAVDEIKRMYTPP